MLIIKEDTLIHTDSSQDIIEHFGIKGMKWGRRKKRFYEKRGYLKNPSPHKAALTLSDFGRIRKIWD